MVGAPLDGDNGAHSGSVYVYLRSGSTWTQQTKMLAADGTANDIFGLSVAITGDTVVVGALDNSGSAYVFSLALSDGDPCSSGPECTSGLCFDGVCCDAPCVGTCQACVATKTGAPDGQCALALEGTDPHGDCAAGAACFSGDCQPKSADGGPCDAATICLSGNCIDGVCCDSACSGLCEACITAKSGAPDGQCAPAPAGTDPDGDCAAATCNGTTLDPADTCDGVGSCTDAGAVDCAPYACIQGACTTSCNQNTDCAAPACCSDGICNDDACESKDPVPTEPAEPIEIARACACRLPAPLLGRSDPGPFLASLLGLIALRRRRRLSRASWAKARPTEPRAAMSATARRKPGPEGNKPE